REGQGDQVTRRSRASGKALALDRRSREGGEPAGAEALVALEEAVDRVILLDIAAFELEEDDRAVEPETELKRRLGEGGVGGEQVELVLLGRFENGPGVGVRGDADGSRVDGFV